MGSSDTLRLLIAAALGATLAMAVPALSSERAAARLRLERANSISAQTGVKGPTAGSVLRLVNTGDGTALELRVQAGAPPLATNSGTRVAKLNADKLDNLHAKDIVRAASNTFPDLGDSDGDRLPVTVNAPRSGVILITAGAELEATGAGADVACFIKVDDAAAVGSMRTVALGPSTSANNLASCETSVAVLVTKGAHLVELSLSGVSGLEVGEGSLWALFVPFHGIGG